MKKKKTKTKTKMLREKQCCFEVVKTWYESIRMLMEQNGEVVSQNLENEKLKLTRDW